jgi:hypothetical protein
MTEIFEYAIVAIIFMFLGMTLADNQTAIDCANTGIAKLNGSVIECHVMRKIK